MEAPLRTAFDWVGVIAALDAARRDDDTHRIPAQHADVITIVTSMHAQFEADAAPRVYCLNADSWRTDGFFVLSSDDAQQLHAAATLAHTN